MTATAAIEADREKFFAVTKQISQIETSSHFQWRATIRGKNQIKFDIFSRTDIISGLFGVLFSYFSILIK